MSGPLIFYVRHGQTDWNAAQRFQGRIDIPLNDKGRAQARRNGKTLAGLLGKAEGFKFISSPLGRSRETMEIIRSEMGLSPSTYALDESLIEMSYGNLEGTTQAEMKAQDRDLYYQRKKNKWTFRPEGGENQEDVLVRIKDWHQTLDPKGQYVVAAHGAVGRVVRHLLGGISVEDAAQFVFPQDKVFKFHNNSEELF